MTSLGSRDPLVIYLGYAPLPNDEISVVEIIIKVQPYPMAEGVYIERCCIKKVNH